MSSDCSLASKSPSAIATLTAAWSTMALPWSLRWGTRSVNAAFRSLPVDCASVALARMTSSEIGDPVISS